MAGPVTLSDPSVAVIALGTVTDPTTCAGTEGSIELTGLAASTSYTVDYTDDGTPVSTSIMSDGTGSLVIATLDAGSYTNISVTESNCTSNVLAGPVTLSDPTSPAIAFDLLNSPSSCGGTNGSIRLSGLNASTAYDIRYFDNSVQVDITNSTNGLGELLIGGLDAGNYTNITVTNQVTGCPSNTLAGPFILSDPGAVTISVFDQTNPTTCGGSEGSIELTGLNASTSYDVTYFDDGVQVDINIISSAAGEIVISGLNGGDYTNISVRDTGSGCTSNIIVGPTTLVDPSGATILEDSFTDPLSCVSSDGTFVLNGLTPTTNYIVDYEFNGVAVNIPVLTSDGGGLLTVSNLSAGNYNNISVTDVNGCQSNVITTAIVLSDPGAVSILASKSDPTSCGGSDGSITITGLNVTTAYSVIYNFNTALFILTPVTSNGAGEIILSGFAAGSITNIRVQEGSCTSNTVPGPFNLVDPTPVTIAFNNIVPPTICGAADGQINLTGLDNSISYAVDYTLNGVVTAGGNFVSDGVGGLSINNLVAGSYDNITVTESNCISNSLIGPFDIIDTGAPIITINNTSNPTTCAGSEGEIELSGLIATTVYNLNYQFNATPVSIQLTSDISGLIQIQSLSAGDYTNISVEEDGTGCFSNVLPGAITLSDPAIPTFNIGITTDPTTCGGSDGNIQLTGLSATTNYNLSFEFNSTPVSMSAVSTDASGNILISGLSAGDFTNFVVQEIGTMCFSDPDATINTLNDSSAPTINLTGNGGPTTCGGSDGSISLIFTNVTDGLYDLDYIDGSATAQTFTGINISGGTATISGLTAGVYNNITITDGACTSSEIINVTLNDPGTCGPTDCGAFTAINPILTRPTCTNNNDGSIAFDIQGGTGNYLVQMTDSGGNPFSTQSAMPTFNNLSPSIYTYTVTDLGNSNICDDGRSVVLEILSTVEGELLGGSTENISCFGETGAVTLTNITPVLGQYFYSIDGGSSWMALPGDNRVEGLNAGITSIRLGSVANDPCPDIIDVTITSVNPVITVNATPSNLTTCDSSDGQVSVDFPPSGGANTGGDDWFIAFKRTSSAITDGDFGTFNEDIIYNNLSADNYTLYIRDISGCTVSEDFDILAPGTVDFTLTQTSAATCSGNGSDGVINVDVTTGTRPFYYSVDGNDFIEAPGFNFSIKDLSVGVHEVVMKPDLDDDGCLTQQVATVTGFGLVDFSFEKTDVTCNLDGDGEISLTDIIGSEDATVDLTITLSLNGAEIIREENFDGTSFVFSNLSKGTYEVKVKQNGGCNSTKNERITIIEPDELNVLLGSINASLPDKGTGSIEIESIEGGTSPFLVELEGVESSNRSIFLSVNLTDGSGTTFNDLNFGLYDLTVLDANGCSQILNPVVGRDSTLFIPNVITPNGDDDNETFYIRNLPDEGSTIVITSRWGREVFKSSNYTNDTAWGGEDTPEGIYFYKLEAAGKIYTGWVEVIKGVKP
ncbi:MAG TPA: gliding motility-associated C-terminal domain-containing protein [Fulvivirga sp.]|nr:gliding motility-associated C-terminal domain-containing protein [Fulvivirga sp.]